MSDTPDRWRWGAVTGTPSDGALRLTHDLEGAQLLVRSGRLARGERYQEASPDARRELARMGALMRLRRRGRYLLHAAGVVDPDGRAWLLTGDSGSGKSTLAYALSRTGWSVLGDDGVIVERAPSDPPSHRMLAHAWRDPLRVSRALEADFPELGTIETQPSPGDVRRRIPVPVRGRALAPRRAPVAALVCLARGAQDVLARLAPGAALPVLIRQSPWVMLDDGDARAHLEALRCIAVDIPAFHLVHSRSQLHTMARTLLGALP